MTGMFYESQATKITGLDGFDTSKVTNMNTMFLGVKIYTLNFNNFDTHNVEDMHDMFSNTSTVYIDLSNFDTSKVTNMNNMFYGSNSLKTVYVSNKFDINKVTTSDYMFEGCSNLVGGKGTKYNSSYIDKTYARIDGGTSSPGYFTLKN